MGKHQARQRPQSDATPDCERIAVELLRALRGRRSRPAFSRYLGYKSNIAQRWETRLCFPRAPRFFAACARCGIDVPSAVGDFLRTRPAWLDGARMTRSKDVAALLRELVGRVPISSLAERSGHSRFAVARWLKGQADPTLPDLLSLVHCASRRLPDFVASLVDPEQLPSMAETWRKLQVAREGAYRLPLSHAVLRALELDTYRNGGHRERDFLSRVLGEEQSTVDEVMSFLLASGQVRRTRRGFRPVSLEMVDTGADRARARGLKSRWMELAVQRLRRGGAGASGYAVFAISRDGLERLRQIQLTYVREMQRVIAESSDNDCVGLYCYQLLDLAESGHEPSAGPRQS